MKFLAIALLAAATCFAQVSDEEQRDLNAALAETGTSAIEFIRALEKHVEKYPESPRIPEFERALAKAAVDAKDERRIILYGERVLAREGDDIQLLDRVTRALLSTEDKETAERALEYAKRYVDLVTEMRSKPAPTRGASQWQTELDRGLGRALALQARAAGNTGSVEEALLLARSSYDVNPSVEAAREIARWLMRSEREEQAIRHLADAFTIADQRATDADRARDRARMGELYRKIHGSEKGLGEIVLEAYDRTSALLAERRLRLREKDPNAAASRPLDFTLSGLEGKKLPLSSLKGKVVIFDFWATWCGPCRAQYPLYEEVKERFKENDDVVFLSVNTDEDRELVEPFLKENGWSTTVYFEDGLSRALEITSIPTTLVVDRRGEIFSRMNGFVPHRFVDMLTERIDEALDSTPE
jgi:thiol-disulfide isomerase/thioredoxin